MKKTIKLFVSSLLIIATVLCFVSCANKTENVDLWESATYTSDKEFGTGASTVKVEVKAEDKSVTFTINTDKTVLGDVLFEYDLIAGDESEYGLYIKKVNGITADYDVDKSYWAFYKNGEYMMSGVDTTEFANGEHYELVYTKE